MRWGEIGRVAWAQLVRTLPAFILIKTVRARLLEFGVERQGARLVANLASLRPRISRARLLRYFGQVEATARGAQRPSSSSRVLQVLAHR